MDKKLVSVIMIAAILVGGYFLYTSGKLPGLPAEGEITNGWWNSLTEECWLDETHGPGVYPPTEDKIPTMFQCCFGQQGYQVDCNDPTKKLGPAQVGAPFAFYGATAPGTPGVFSVSHGITITNTGNILINLAWIEAATWTPAHVALTTAYSTVVGSVNGKGPIATSGGYAIWSTGPINLQDVGTDTGQLYSLSLDTFASAIGLPDSPKTTEITMYVKQEVIGFSVDINIGG